MVILFLYIYCVATFSGTKMAALKEFNLQSRTTTVWSIFSLT